MEQDDPLENFTRRDITLDGVTEAVYVVGAGPAVIVMTKMPGISPHVGRFARGGPLQVAALSLSSHSTGGSVHGRNLRGNRQAGQCRSGAGRGRPVDEVSKRTSVFLMEINDGRWGSRGQVRDLPDIMRRARSDGGGWPIGGGRRRPPCCRESWTRCIVACRTRNSARSSRTAQE
jgi:hypothetical protein